MLTNPYQGNVDLVVDGKTYVLRFGWLELAKVEKALGMKLFAFANYFTDEENMSANDIVKIFHIALSRNHPELDELAAGDIMDRSQGGFMEKLTEAVTSAFPKATEKGNGDARPIQADDEANSNRSNISQPSSR